MSSKKPEKSDKTEDKKDKSAMAEINNIEKTIKNLTASLNKLKTKFKTKGESSKKEQTIDKCLLSTKNFIDKVLIF